MKKVTIRPDPKGSAGYEVEMWPVPAGGTYRLACVYETLDVALDASRRWLTDERLGVDVVVPK